MGKLQDSKESLRGEGKLKEGKSPLLAALPFSLLYKSAGN
jgi:hypothetical protein